MIASFEAEAPNQRWVGDTTELVIGGSQRLFLAAVLDLFSRFIVGWAISAVNDRHLTIKALEMALKRRCPEAGLQGCTYASEDYQDVLEAHGISVQNVGGGWARRSLQPRTAGPTRNGTSRRTQQTARSSAGKITTALSRCAGRRSRPSSTRSMKPRS